MPSFQDQFVASKGQPIEYQGNTLVMVDFFPIEDGAKLRLTFESTDGPWRQGVSVRLRENGSLILNGQESQQFACWRDTAPQVVEFEALGEVTRLEIKNVWDVGNGVMESWHNGAAMIVEETPCGRRYRCNDGYADDDFDDIIFRIERLN
ncbi:MAG: hypothetical protein KF847_21165 [Pirellulales bacterium]|nr:hypothetical protein [Pirellulales bacterium]